MPASGLCGAGIRSTISPDPVSNVTMQVSIAIRRPPDWRRTSEHGSSGIFHDVILPLAKSIRLIM
jgi:hypothetical protein